MAGTGADAFTQALLALDGHTARMREAAKLAVERPEAARAAVARLLDGIAKAAADPAASTAAVDTWEGNYILVAAARLKDADALATTALQAQSWMLRARAVHALAGVDQRRLFSVVTDPAAPAQLRRTALPVLSYIDLAQADAFMLRVLSEPQWGGPWCALDVLRRLERSAAAAAIVRTWLRRCADLAESSTPPSAEATRELGLSGVAKRKKCTIATEVGVVYTALAHRHPDALLAVLRVEKGRQLRRFAGAASTLVAQRTEGVADALRNDAGLRGEAELHMFLRPLAKRAATAALDVIDLLPPRQAADALAKTAATLLRRRMHGVRERLYARAEALVAHMNDDQKERVLGAVLTEVMATPQTRTVPKLTRDYATRVLPRRHEVEVTSLQTTAAAPPGRVLRSRPPRVLLRKLSVANDYSLSSLQSYTKAMTVDELVAWFTEKFSPSNLADRRALEVYTTDIRGYLTRIPTTQPQGRYQLAFSRFLTAAYDEVFAGDTEALVELVGVGRRTPGESWVLWGGELLAGAGDPGACARGGVLPLEPPLREALEALVADPAALRALSPEARCSVLAHTGYTHAEAPLRELSISSDPTMRTAALTALWASAMTEWRERRSATAAAAALPFLTGHVGNESAPVRNAVVPAVLDAGAIDTIRMWFALPEATVRGAVDSFAGFVVKWEDVEAQAVLLRWACAVVTLGGAYEAPDAATGALVAHVRETVFALKPYPRHSTFKTLAEVWKGWCERETSGTLGTAARGGDAPQRAVVAEGLRRVEAAGIAAMMHPDFAPPTITRDNIAHLPAFATTLRDDVDDCIALMPFPRAEVFAMANLNVAFDVIDACGPAFARHAAAVDYITAILASLPSLVASKTHGVAYALAQGIFGKSPDTLLLSNAPTTRGRDTIVRSIVTHRPSITPATRNALVSWSPFAVVIRDCLRALARNTWASLRDMTPSMVASAASPGWAFASMLLNGMPLGVGTAVGRALQSRGLPAALAYEVSTWWVPHRDTVLAPCAAMFAAARPFRSLTAMCYGGVLYRCKIDDALQRMRRHAHRAPEFRDILLHACNALISVNDVERYMNILRGPTSPVLDAARAAGLKAVQATHTGGVNNILFHGWIAWPAAAFDRSRGRRRLRWQRGERAVRVAAKRAVDAATRVEDETRWMGAAGSAAKTYVGMITEEAVRHEFTAGRGLTLGVPQRAGGLTPAQRAVLTIVLGAGRRELPAGCSGVLGVLPALVRLDERAAAELAEATVVGLLRRNAIAASSIHIPKGQVGSRMLDVTVKTLIATPVKQPALMRYPAHLLLRLAADRQRLLCDVLRALRSHHPPAAQLQHLGCLFVDGARMPTGTALPWGGLRVLAPEVQGAVETMCGELVTAAMEGRTRTGCVDDDDPDMSACVTALSLAIGVAGGRVGGARICDPAHPVNVFFKGVEERRLAAADLQGPADDAAAAMKVLTVLASADDPEAVARTASAHIGRCGVGSKAAVLSTALALRCIPQPAAADVLHDILPRATMNAAGRTQLARAAVQLLPDMPERVRGILAIVYAVEDDAGSGATRSSDDHVMVRGEEEASCDEVLSKVSSESTLASVKVMVTAALATSPLLARMPAHLAALDATARRCAAGASSVEDDAVLTAVLQAVGGSHTVKTLNTPTWPVCAPPALAGVVARLLSVDNFQRLAADALRKWVAFVKQLPEDLAVDALRGTAGVLADAFADQPVTNAMMPLLRLLVAGGYVDDVLGIVDAKVAAVQAARGVCERREALGQLAALSCTGAAGEWVGAQKDLAARVEARLTAAPLTRPLVLRMLAARLHDAVADDGALLALLRAMAVEVAASDGALLTHVSSVVAPVWDSSIAAPVARQLMASADAWERRVGVVVALAAPARKAHTVDAEVTALAGDPACAALMSGI